MLRGLGKDRADRQAMFGQSEASHILCRPIRGETHMALVSGRVVTCAGTSGSKVLTNEKAGVTRADQSEVRDVEITGRSRAQTVPTGHT